MANIYNSDLTKELVEGAKLQLSREYPPNQIADKVVPVMEVNPKLLRRTNLVRNFSSTTTAGSTTLVTAENSKDIFITGISVHIVKDAVCDAATGNVSFTLNIDGAARTIISLGLITLTAQQISREVIFENPIKIDRGSSITYSSTTFTAGVCLRSYQIYGYYVDNPNS